MAPSLTLFPVHSFLYPDWPVQYVAAGWMSVKDGERLEHSPTVTQ